MPVVFIHGVAVRRSDDPAFGSVERITRGTEWASVEAALRRHVAPVLNPVDPEGVSISAVYWGDLGVQLPGPGDAGVRPFAGDASSRGAGLPPDELGELLEASLVQSLPAQMWPEVVRAVWAVVNDPGTHGELADQEGDELDWLTARVRERLGVSVPELTRRLGPFTAELSVRPRRTLQHGMSALRRPGRQASTFLPIFIGDVLRYLAGRGAPGAPGAITERVLTALAAARDSAQRDHEPLVILTHSMGGQLLYDALTAFDTETTVDFWCASGGQLAMFADFGVFLEADYAGTTPIEDRVGYLWNAWSSSDILSFPAEGRVARAHDTDFAFVRPLGSSHTAYLLDDNFYRVLAAKVEAHAIR